MARRDWYLVVLLVINLLPGFGQGRPSSAKFRHREIGTATNAGIIPGLLGSLQARQSTCPPGYDVCSSGLVCCPVGGNCCLSKSLHLRSLLT